MAPRLVVEAESVRMTNSQALFGKVYLAGEPNTYFPELGWTDFVVSILDNCLKVVSELRPGDLGRVSFLDGPFALEFTRLDMDRLKIAGKRRTQSTELEVLNMESRHDVFMESLVSAAEAIVRAADVREWGALSEITAVRYRLAAVKRARGGKRIEPDDAGKT